MIPSQVIKFVKSRKGHTIYVVDSDVGGIRVSKRHLLWSLARMFPAAELSINQDNLPVIFVSADKGAEESDG